MQEFHLGKSYCSSLNATKCAPLLPRKAGFVWSPSYNFVLEKEIQTSFQGR